MKEECKIVALGVLLPFDGFSQMYFAFSVDLATLTNVAYVFANFYSNAWLI